MSKSPLPAEIVSILESPAFKAAAAQADALRIERHHKAAAALLEAEADTAEIQDAAAAFAAAEKALADAEPAYLAARARLADAHGQRRTAEWRHEHQLRLLRAELAKHIPPILAETEDALGLIDTDIRGALTVRETPPTGFLRPGRTTSNAAEVDAARTAVATMRAVIARLTMQPASEAEVVAELSRLSLQLIEVARAAGAMVAWRLPEQLRNGFPAEKPERTEPVAYATQISAHEASRY
ncbi:MAG: hypothetical protein B7Y26_03595 [Hydrogenophilales bacterium 16-64-46]|nr:MAG: hypothetical protein B7Z32_03295 [Hydrogenophilales bacterium 12-64-13]OYZ06877.1 MAG: hypothetical protein B7Y26_03595 [Hydrogenophilales bacterium 16-64-46]OZA37021.1 MAG: hypothetical protein B7X87_11990 [Hydrogenophilales bacterium 17-64-34]HQS99905.1 hypothetical protein [Thiobacillus sp.]